MADTVTFEAVFPSVGINIKCHEFAPYRPILTLVLIETPNIVRKRVTLDGWNFDHIDRGFFLQGLR